LKIGFDDIGFTTAEPFDSQKEVLLSRHEEYNWIIESGFKLLEATDPKNLYPNAKSIIVVIASYFKEDFPASLVGKFGRCYLDDDRITQDGLMLKVYEFQNYLRDNGIDSIIPPNLPHRIAAARAGLGTFGKNSLLYSNKLVRGGSWILPIPYIVDQEFTPDDPTYEIGCPKWCKNVCIIACPTGALKVWQRAHPQRTQRTNGNVGLWL